MTAKSLQPEEYSSYYQTYIQNTDFLTLKNGLQSNGAHVISFFENIPENKHDFRYEEGKWTLKEMLLHIIDTERIFSFRALHIARKDSVPLPGFDQDSYVAPSKANERPFKSLLNEYKMVRQSTIALFNSFDEEMLLEIGIANHHPISVRAIGFIIIGHENHHCDIVKERYL